MRALVLLMASGLILAGLALSPKRAAAADAGVVAVGMPQSGGSVALMRAQTLEIRLPAQFGTGASWRLASLEGDVLRLSDSRVESGAAEADAAQPGAAETQVFVFLPVAAGSARVAFEYKRPWETEKPPEQVFTLSVSVGE
jgi:inhibitor of cysteine peptidase